MSKSEELLQQAGVKPTPNRLLVLRQLMQNNCPVSLGELEESLETLEKSSILRVLNLLAENHLVHTVEDGRGIVKYEVCHSADHNIDSDIHVHFYCEKCRNVVCFESIPVPDIPLPEGYEAHSVNYMIKGVCPECGKQQFSKK